MNTTTETTTIKTNMSYKEINVTDLLAHLEKIQKELAHNSSNADAFFLVINGVIIYFMQCGFAFLECGAVRSKNATNILIKNILDSFIGAIAYWLFGWPLAFGEGNSFFGYKYWAASSMRDAQYPLFFFHFVFAATAATIVSGAMAERCEFLAYTVYSFFITGFVYPVVTHWAWSSEGWLGQGFDITHNNETVNIVYRDFAGSGVVHLLGGTAALVGTAFLGPRIGRFHPRKKDVHVDLKGHSAPLAALGTFILIFGFFAFNGGSQASISQEGDGDIIALAVVNTIIAAAFGAMTAMVLNSLILTLAGDSSKWSLLTTVNGSLAGMVSIYAGCNVMQPWGACITGTMAGIVYLGSSWLVLKLRVDDPLDAVAVHLCGGLWGVVATPLFAREDGIIYNGSKTAFMSLGWNLAGAAAIMAWSAVLSTLMFGTLSGMKILRVSAEVEIKGLDIPKHAEPAYPSAAYGDGWSSTYTIDSTSPQQKSKSLDDDELLKPPVRKRLRSIQVDNELLANYASNLQIGRKTLPHYRVNLPYGLRQESLTDDLSHVSGGEIQLQIPQSPQSTSKSPEPVVEVSSLPSVIPVTTY